MSQNRKLTNAKAVSNWQIRSRFDTKYTVLAATYCVLRKSLSKVRLGNQSQVYYHQQYFNIKSVNIFRLASP